MCEVSVYAHFLSRIHKTNVPFSRGSLPIYMNSTSLENRLSFMDNTECTQRKPGYVRLHNSLFWQ